MSVVTETNFCHMSVRGYYEANLRLHSWPNFIDGVFAKISPKRSFQRVKMSVLGFFRENWVYTFGHRFDSNTVHLKCQGRVFSFSRLLKAVSRFSSCMQVGNVQSLYKIPIENS
jgi:hypothetical protein